MRAEKFIGIDIGGTKTHLGVVCNGQVTLDWKVPTPSQGPKMELVNLLKAEIERVIDKDVLGIGIGVPGLADEERGVVYGVQNIPSWQEVPLKKYLEDYFQIPVYITNDANTFVLGEKIYGKGKEFAHMVGITLGTGLGVGIIIHHQLYSGVYSSAGEFGAIPYRDKTFEHYCSGRFFLETLGVKGKEAFQMALAGERESIQAFQDFGQQLGDLFHHILFTLAPQAIFLGGSISKCMPLFEATLFQRLEEFPFGIVKQHLRIAPASIDHSALLGAAGLAKMKLAYKESMNPT
jgi:glucokinase